MTDKQNTVPAEQEVTTVLIVDDHPAIQETLQMAIGKKEDFAVAGAVTSEDEALRFIRSSPPNLVIADIGLRESYGLKLIREIHTESQDIFIVVYSMFDEYIYASRSISAGAHGYVMKTSPVRQLFIAIDTVLQGDIYVSDEMASYFLDTLDVPPEQDTNRRLDVLSDRELAVFHCLGAGRSITEISDQLDTSKRVIRAARRKIKKKLELDSVREVLDVAIHWFNRYSTIVKGSSQIDDLT